jgi:hypothetical protein
MKDIRITKNKKALLIKVMFYIIKNFIMYIINYFIIILISMLLIKGSKMLLKENMLKPFNENVSYSSRYFRIQN